MQLIISAQNVIQISVSAPTQHTKPCAAYLAGLLFTEIEDVGLDTEAMADGTVNVFASANSISLFSARSIASISAVSANSLISSITPSHSKKLPSR